MIGYILVVLLAGANVAFTFLLIRQRSREAYRKGWDHAILRGRAGLHPLLSRDWPK